jgi:hypothetical protein
MYSALTTWIALIEVRPRPGVTILDSDQVGAFVTVIILASDECDLDLKLREALDSLGLDLVQRTETELLAERVKHFQVEEGVLALAETVDANDPVAFDEFCVFPLSGDGEE